MNIIYNSVTFTLSQTEQHKIITVKLIAKIKHILF